ncbi:DUF7344 domain-containing protein [Halorubrum gandharaense]
MVGQSRAIAKDEVFSLLSSQRRRYALHACKQTDDAIDISDLAEQVAAWEYGKEVAALTSEERRRVYTALQQTHLPAMEEAGVIDVERSEIELTEQAQELDVYMDVVPEDSIPWAEYYLGLSAVGATLLGMAWAGLYPASVPDVALAGVVVSVFLISAAAHVLESRGSRLGSEGLPPELNA